MTWTVAFRVQGDSAAGGTRRNRLSGGKRRFTLGEYPTVSLAEAREKALAVRRIARAGTDAVDTLRPKPKVIVTVSDVIARYETEHIRRNLRAGGNFEKLLALHVTPRWGERELSSITRTDFVALLEEVRRPTIVSVKTPRGTYNATRGGPGSAGEVRKWIRALFQFACDVELLKDNPLTNVRNRDRQKPRSRVLTPEPADCASGAGD